MIINESISILRNPESIWSFWMEVSNDVLWRDGIIKAEWTSQPPHGIGSKGEHTHKNMGIMKWETTRIEDGRSFEFVHTSGGLKGSIAYFKVEAENKGSRVTVQMRMSGPIIMRFMIFFMGDTMRKSVRNDLLKLKKLLEKQKRDV